MRKIPTLFKKNPENLGLVIDEVNPGCEWVFNGEGVATRKFDGTAAAVINQQIYKRYDVKKGRSVPPNAIPCQEPDEITGHWPHWVLCEENKPEDKYFLEAFYTLMVVCGPALAQDEKCLEGTYELVGEKVQGNPEKINGHSLYSHGAFVLKDAPPPSFSALRSYLAEKDIEGIVYHHPDGRMCKIRKSDFGIQRKN